jgi:hypothetical protein
MPWYSAFGFGPRAPARKELPDMAALVAAVAPVRAPQGQFMRHPDRWQNQVWGYFDTLGEYNYGVQWLASMLSRVRLRAAKMTPGSDEPEIIDVGPAAEIMAKLGRGVGGQSELMRRMSVQLSVPGECYLIGEERFGEEIWSVRSIDEVRASASGATLENGGGWEVTDESNPNLGQIWRPLEADSIPVRIWRPHDRWYHLADSPSRSALEILRELELVNRHILAQYLSRLASAGVLLLPEEVSFPAKEEYADSADPFVEEWIDIAAQAIKNPGDASSIIPIILRLPSDYIAAVKHLDFTLKIDDHIIDKRNSVLKRLATKLDLPSSVLLGLEDMNHWNAFADQESGTREHVAPAAETICDALTHGYLKPRLEASGEDPAGWVAWYDLSELEIKPDRSQNAEAAYDRMELSGEAYRRENGFNETDAPTDEELKTILLKNLVRTAHGAAPGAVDILVGTELLTPATQGPGASDSQVGIVPEPGQHLPEGEQAPVAPAAPPDKTAPAGPPQKAEASAEDVLRRHQQATTQHVLVFRAGEQWDLRHPDVCGDHAYACPFTEAVAGGGLAVRPGTPGSYMCRLDAFGRLRIDGPALYTDLSGMASTLLTPAGANGRSRG